MKSLKLVLLAVFLGTVASGNFAWADRGHWGGGGGHFSGHQHRHFSSHVGVFFGAPLFYPWYWSDPYPYYYPYSSPPVYVEQGDPASGYWYHCNNPSGYYPTVKECPAGWTKIAPSPPQ